MFLLKKPFPFDGTIVAVNASGYCTIAGGTERLRPFVMRLSLYNGYRKFNVYKNVPANCDWSTEDYDDEILLGSVKELITMDVKAGQTLAIEFNDECDRLDGGKETFCTFTPATTVFEDRELDFQYIHTQPDYNIALNDSVKLQFSYELRKDSYNLSYILEILNVFTHYYEFSGSCSQEPGSSTGNSTLILALVIAFVMAVIIVAVSVILLLFFRNRQKGVVASRSAPIVEANNCVASLQLHEEVIVFSRLPN